VAPGGVLDVRLDILCGLHRGAGKDLGEGDGLIADGPAGDADGLGDGL
jgi:hypothetical protein